MISELIRFYPQFIVNLISNQDPHPKVRMMQHQGKNIPMTIVQKTQKQTKLLLSPLSYRRYEFLTFKEKRSLESHLYMDEKIV